LRLKIRAGAGTVLAWDPADRTLIAANLVGTMPWTERRYGARGCCTRG
jgi:hypothetical protein